MYNILRVSCGPRSAPRQRQCYLMFLSGSLNRTGLSFLRLYRYIRLYLHLLWIVLQNVELQNVKLQNAEFQNVELQNAELQNAELQNAESYRT